MIAWMLVRLFAVAVLCCLFAACGGADEQSLADASPETVERGERHYQQTCATCHGSDAMGLPRLGKALRGNEFVRTAGDAEVLALLMGGRPASHPRNTTGVDMPPRGGNPALGEVDLQAVVAYLRTLQ